MMPMAHMIGRRSSSSAPAGAGSRERWGQLPDDLLREASHRLAVMGLLGAVLWLTGTFLDHVFERRLAMGDPEWFHPLATDAIALISFALSLVVYVYARMHREDNRRVPDLGLVYMVLTALGLGLISHWEPVPRGTDLRPMISWIGCVILMFAAIIPSTPGKTMVAGIIAVSMNPIGMLIQRARGAWDFGPTGNALVMHYPDYMLIGVAVVISRVVTRLGYQVTKAREMGSYQLGELLGKGGMGEVYQATHRMLARPAAIKLIRPEMLGAGSAEKAELAVKRFKREAEAAASLRSPHTVELYDFGVTDDQTLYFVMELLDGMDLESLVRSTGPAPAARVIHVLRQVCESLEEAHLRGLVHRDIKPANIHLGRVGLQYDFVKVLDFGLVKSIETRSDEHSLGTAEGLTPGTPAYMAPEMALGEPVDGRADLYALGCVAYYLLTGSLVFEADGGFQIIARHVSEAPIPPSRRTEIQVPSDLEGIVLACLAKKPADRPATAAELGRRLAAIDLAPWSEEEAIRWWKAHRPGMSTPGAL
jgi:eukaryotic-like serine/threonine-protein kinase